MAIQWTSEQVLALSPDAGSTQRGQALATVAKWPTLGFCKEGAARDRAVWGECKGSGKKPYRTVIDLSAASGEPAFRCSCPSRKFPCKHALGLFLLFSAQLGFTESAPPDWASEWLGQREQKATQQETQGQRLENRSVEEQVEQSGSALVARKKNAQAQSRLEKRFAKVSEGLVDLDQWLQDLVRHGLADLPAQPYSFWDQTAARLVDAQAPGLASRVRELAGIPHSGMGWPERMLQSLGSLHLLVRAYEKREYLSAPMRAEVLKQIGFSQKKEELVQQSHDPESGVMAVADVWHVLGKVITEEEALKSQRVWLWGVKSQRAALVLSFAHGRRQPLDASLVPGDSFEGTLVFYPGAGQNGTGLRALVLERRPQSRPSEAPRSGFGDERIEDAIARYTDGLIQNPWQLRFPLILLQVLFRHHAGHWWLQDSEGQLLPIASDFAQGWEILAMSGGGGLTVFGEWAGESFLPLSVWSRRKFMAIGR